MTDNSLKNVRKSSAETAQRPARDHRQDLARLLPMWPHDLADISIAGRRRLIRVMARALRAERCRGRAGHWAYDLARHAALFRAWKAERAALKVLERQLRRSGDDRPLNKPLIDPQSR